MHDENARRSVGSKIRSYALPILLFIAVIAVWEISTTVFGVPEYIIPPLSKIVRVFGDLPLIAIYLQNALVTLQEAMLGLLIGGSLGFVAGVILTGSRTLFQTFYPYIIALQCMPKVAIAPLLVIWFGFGQTSKVVVVGLLAFFPILVNTISGIRSVPQEGIELFRAIKASRLSTLRHLLIPAALPSIMTGIELAVVVSLLGAIIGEFVGAEQGIGILLLQAQFQMNIPAVFALLIILAGIGIILNLAVRAIRRRALFWIPAEKNN